MAAAERSEHYFAATPTAASRPREVLLELPDLHLTLTTDRGVFAPDAVDVGTRYLLLDAPMPPTDRALTVADVGCGYGPIALTLATRLPRATVVAVDVNERARALCRANAERHALTNVQVLEPQDIPADLQIDALYANPPIRVGNEALHLLLQGWLARLRPEGRAVLVVHKHLGSDSLLRWLDGAGHTTTRLGSRLGYRLLQIVPGPPTATSALAAGTTAGTTPAAQP